VRQVCSDKPEGQCREIIRTWVRNGVLYPKDYDDPVQRKTLSGLFVDGSSPGEVTLAGGRAP
jgi:hypothetical protein